jgi:hypothetical protein
MGRVEGILPAKGNNITCLFRYLVKIIFCTIITEL